MSIWLSISGKLKKIFKISDKKYLHKLLDSLEQKIEKDENIPFRIIETKENGFLAKTNGLYAYIPFKYMPWDYSVKESWKAISTSIQGKVFFGKVLRFKKDPIEIRLHARVPQFKKPELVVNAFYKGIVINKAKYGIFVDIGYHFDWKCGSLVGLLHKSNCKNKMIITDNNPGNEIDMYLLDINLDNQLVFTDDTEIREWYTGEIKNLIGQIASVEVLKNNEGNMEFKVYDKYDGELSLDHLKSPGEKKKMNERINALRNKETFTCKIIGVNQNQKKLILKADINMFPQTTNIIANSMDEETFVKLQNLK